MFTSIDTLETQEVLAEYYDFSTTTQEQWLAIDKLVQTICTERGIPTINQTPEEFDMYCAILDGVCAKAGIKKI